MKNRFMVFIAFFIIFVSGCSGNSADSDVLDSSESEKNKENKDSVIWALPQDYENDMDLQDNIVFLNEKLKKDGYGFTVSLTFVPGEEENYYSRMLELLESGNTDIAFLGLDGEQEAW